jgi:pimeloyl-ACP methyl ester carboxylesterase
MRTRLLKSVAKVAGIAAALIVVLLAVGPFLVPVRPLGGLVAAQAVAPDDSRFITIPFEGTDGLDIHYFERGSDAGGTRPTFVLLHGSMFNAFTWDQTLDFFAERGRVIAYDQIPYGLSEKLIAGDWDTGNPYAASAAVDHLFSLLDELGVGRAVLVGNSYGAVIAVQAALAQPERVEELVLVDAAVYVEEEMPAWLMNLPQVRRLGPVLARQLGQNEGFLRQTYSDPDRISDDRLAATSIHTRVADWDLALWEYLRVWSVDLSALAGRFGEIEQPALIVSGDSDTIVPVADSQRLDEALPNSELVILPQCGHVPQEECPEAFMGAVDAWLRR